MPECISPFEKRHEITGKWLLLPCGKCAPCLKRRVSGWSYRLSKHEKEAQASFFVTLTYDTQYVPITNNGFMSLCKTDLQKFFKRLRKLHPKDSNIKYYAVGEYGGKTNRPHYHIILFNADIKLVEKAWKFGYIHNGQVSEASIGYTLKYVSKAGKIPMHQNDDRQKEFALMSKRIGTNYLTPNMVQWHKADLNNRMYCNLPDGKKIAMPRYYKDKIYTDQERKQIGEHIQQKLIQKNDENHKKYGCDCERYLVSVKQNVINTSAGLKRIQDKL